MKINFKLLIFSLFLTAFSFPQNEKITLFLAGDSTMQNYKEHETPMRGWGQYLHEFFNEEVKVVNKAIGGRSTRSFIKEGRWQAIMDQVKPGDYVFIQFGHNDQSSKPERYTSPEDYRINLIKFITEAKARNVNPVLLTPITMRIFNDDGTVRNGLGVYPTIVREVAADMDIPLIDMNKTTTHYVGYLGDEASKEIYMWLKPGEHPKYPEGLQDNTHLRESGARKYASLATEGIQELKLKPLMNYLKDQEFSTD
jgi:lysophospholipase L1-like esterase